MTYRITDVFLNAFNQDELARIRRQSISRIPSVRVSDPNGDLPSNESSGDSKDPLFDPLRSSTEGSFLQFSRAVLGPTALSHKVTVLTNLTLSLTTEPKSLNSTFSVDPDSVDLSGSDCSDKDHGDPAGRLTAKREAFSQNISC